MNGEKKGHTMPMMTCEWAGGGCEVSGQERVGGVVPHIHSHLTGAQLQPPALTMNAT